MDKVIIELKNITKIFDGERIVDDINLSIYENEFITLLGPSGCGKTTTLRMLGGFITPDQGQIILDNKIVNDLPPYARPLNTVFQRYALFPHLNVFDNIAFGLANKPYKLKVAHFGLENLQNAARAYYNIPTSKKVNVFQMESTISRRIAEEVNRLLKLVNLVGFEKRKVAEMSGGQQQRVAIARALINRPRILLLDEPLAALDLKLRHNMQYELKEMQKTLGITFVFVTHDQEEAMTMSDRIVVMNNGKIVQMGIPKFIYNEPVNRYVANFIGESNIVEGVYVAEDKVKFMDQTFDVVGYKFEIGEKVDVVIRPEDFDVVALNKAKLVGTITSSIFKGVYNELLIDIKGREFVAHSFEHIEIGGKVGLKVDPYEIHLMKVEKNNEHAEQ